MTDKDKVQGEGDYESAKEYNEATRNFVEGGGVENAPDPSEQSDQASAQAEAEGKARAKELDPAVHRDTDEPAKP